MSNNKGNTILKDLSEYYKNPSFLKYNSVINDLQFENQSQKDSNLVYTLSRIKVDAFNYLLSQESNNQQKDIDLKLIIEKESTKKAEEVILNLLKDLF